MSFGKSFLINFVSILVLNTGFIMLAYTFGYGFNDLITEISMEPIYILYLLFCPLGRAIWLNFDGMIYAVQAATFSILILNIAYLMAPLCAVIITGRMSDDKINSLLAFMATAIISMIVCIILVLYNIPLQIEIGQDFTQSMAILNVVLGSVINGCLYGLIALALTRKKKHIIID